MEKSVEAAETQLERSFQNFRESLIQAERQRRRFSLPRCWELRHSGVPLLVLLDAEDRKEFLTYLREKEQFQWGDEEAKGPSVYHTVMHLPEDYEFPLVCMWDSMPMQTQIGMHGFTKQHHLVAWDRLGEKKDG